jgi:hypothetical protein
MVRQVGTLNLQANRFSLLTVEFETSGSIKCIRGSYPAAREIDLLQNAWAVLRKQEAEVHIAGIEFHGQATSEPAVCGQPESPVRLKAQLGSRRVALVLWDPEAAVVRHVGYRLGTNEQPTSDRSLSHPHLVGIAGEAGETAPLGQRDLSLDRPQSEN